MLESRYQIVTEGLQELYRRASSGECIDWDNRSSSTENATYKILSKLGMFQSDRALEFNDAGGHNITENPMLQQSTSWRGSSCLGMSAESESSANSTSSAANPFGTNEGLEQTFHFPENVLKQRSPKPEQTPVPFLQIAADSGFGEYFQCNSPSTMRAMALMDTIDTSAWMNDAEIGRNCHGVDLLAL